MNEKSIEKSIEHYFPSRPPLFVYVFPVTALIVAMGIQCGYFPTRLNTMEEHSYYAQCRVKDIRTSYLDSTAQYQHVLQGSLVAVLRNPSLVLPRPTRTLLQFQPTHLERELMDTSGDRCLVEFPADRSSALLAYQDAWKLYEANLSQVIPRISSLPPCMLDNGAWLQDELAVWCYEAAAHNRTVPEEGIFSGNATDVARVLIERYGSGDGAMVLPPRIRFARTPKESLQLTGLSPLRLVPLYERLGGDADTLGDIHFVEYRCFYWELVSVVRDRQGREVLLNGKSIYRPMAGVDIVVHAWLFDYLTLSQIMIANLDQTNPDVSIDLDLVGHLNPLVHLVAALVFPYENGAHLYSQETEEQFQEDYSIRVKAQPRCAALPTALLYVDELLLAETRLLPDQQPGGMFLVRW